MRRIFRSGLFYNANAPKLGQELVTEVERVLAMAVEHPEIGIAAFHRCRRILVRRFPFNVFYQVRGDVIYVIALAHQHRKPDYWHTRVTP